MSEVSQLVQSAKRAREELNHAYLTRRRLRLSEPDNDFMIDVAEELILHCRDKLDVSLKELDEHILEMGFDPLYGNTRRRLF